MPRILISLDGKQVAEVLTAPLRGDDRRSSEEALKDFARKSVIMDGQLDEERAHEATFEVTDVGGPSELSA